MNGAREFGRQNTVDLALPRDAAFSGKARGHDLNSKMRFLAALRARMVTGVKVGIVIDGKTLGVERGLKLLAYVVRYFLRHWLGFAPKRLSVKTRP